MAAKLKVFVTSDGLTEYAVATSSRPKALAAWGVHQDLFKQGAARETDDAALVEAASARPGEVVERALKARGAVKAFKSPPAPKKKEPSKAARKQVAELEAKLAAAQEAHRARLDEIEDARADLDARQAREDGTYRSEREKLSERLSRAKAALRG